jgi:transposase
MVRVGWFKEVQVKSLAAHERMALLGVRRRLVDIRVEIDGQIRGILKTFGLVVGSGSKGAFAQRARMLAQDHPILSALVENCSAFGRSPLPRWRCLTRKSAVSSAMIQPCDAS